MAANAPSSVLAADCDDDFPEVRVALHVFVRRAKIVEREDAIDLCTQLTSRKQRKQRALEMLCDRDLFFDRPAP